MMFPVAALVVSYHTGPRLTECLYALKSDPAISEIIIADNGNPAEVQAWLDTFVTTSAGKVKLIRLENPGFGAAVNRAALETGASILLVINPDCVIRRGSVQQLAEALEGTAGPAIVGGRIFGVDGKEQRGARRNTLTLPVALGLSRWTLETLPAPQGSVRVGAISGAFFMMRRADFQMLGGFDERYFLHVEDVDLCRRAIEAGGAVIYQPLAGALHYTSTSDVPSATVQAHKAQSLARYFRKFAKGPLERAFVELCVPFIALALKLRR
ncbi:glycosyl transferase, group 2 family protein [Hyphomonas neptunium ATCC 15444]|uniref:Glycosyl transferase, group 2 family protein n=2 Tax=Hyphomonas TaxID=85 RepID=Q0BXC4_HYPNA|nr:MULTISPECIES: glycosyltransferase family 2 protein [Hyphomonas]ABI77671.1 glycosyl transferase, group 2 family protein [Hyphomonas neptunium ATCC 15444]KCZ86935.1 glycosyl transferase group 2 family protein [Hyphomonas hirschiana VP5]